MRLLGAGAGGGRGRWACGWACARLLLVVAEREDDVQHVAAAERLLQDHRELALAEGHVLRALREALDDQRELGEREVDLEALLDRAAPLLEALGAGEVDEREARHALALGLHPGHVDHHDAVRARLVGIRVALRAPRRVDLLRVLRARDDHLARVLADVAAPGVGSHIHCLALIEQVLRGRAGRDGVGRAWA